MKYLVIVPAFNEAPIIYQTLVGLKKTVQSTGKFDIIVIDDGSTDETRSEAKKAGITVVRHRLNRGLGGALSTGIEFAKRHEYDLAVTFDADGQHNPADVLKAIKPIEEGRADVVIGSRTTSQKGRMPWDRVLLNWGSNLLTWVLFGVWTTDSQSGFRAFSKHALQVIELKTERMEVSSEFFAEIKKHHLKVMEIPITVIYTDYSRKKGQDNLNALNVFAKLLLRLAR